MNLSVLRFPDKRLRIQAKPVQVVDARIKTIVKDMFETMYAQYGIGLAATQVNIHKQIVVMDVPSEQTYKKIQNGRNQAASNDAKIKPMQNNPLCFINPVISRSSGKVESEEGCLSVPDYNAVISRYKSITIEALNQEGEPFILSVDGLLAICIQHELDHLKGKLFIDYLSKLKQNRLRIRYSKEI